MKWEYPETNGLLPYIWSTHCFMRNNVTVPLFAVSAYLCWCYFGQKYFENRKPWNLRRAMILWNIGLSLFSWYGAIRIWPAIYFAFTRFDLRENFCSEELVDFMWGRGSIGFVSLIFVLSKFPELIDTFFIVVHKKPLIFLHWYHHVSVLLYCWNAYAWKTGCGSVFMAMNYTVHAIMYGYYGLMAAKLKPKWLKAQFITVAQISQMVVGVTLTGMNFYYYLTDKDGTCNVGPPMLWAGSIMYGSYLCLFLQFFLERFVWSKKKTKKA